MRPVHVKAMALALAACGIAAMATAAEPSGSIPATGAPALYTGRCGMCHQANGMGVGLLSRRPGDTSKGLLEARGDLSAAYVKVVVRNGLGNMPRISRGEVSDPELDSIAAYLSKGKP